MLRRSGVTSRHQDVSSGSGIYEVERRPFFVTETVTSEWELAQIAPGKGLIGQIEKAVETTF